MIKMCKKDIKNTDILLVVKNKRKGILKNGKS